MSEKKNILILSANDVNVAAGIIAYDLHKGLNTLHHSEIMVRHTMVKEKGVISYYPSWQNFIYRGYKKYLTKNYSVKTNKDYKFFEIDQNKNIINFNKVKRRVTKPDYIIAYFMHYYFSLKDLYKLQEYYKVPVLLAMADMVYITGGCHYAWDCDGYKKECKNCPAIIKENEKHYANDNLRLNKELIDKMDISILAFTSQDYEFAKNSTLFKNKAVDLVFGGINLETFNYQNKQSELKSKYGIGPEDFVILFGAVKIGEKRKGVQYFIDAISYLEKQKKSANITIVSIGQGRLQDILPDTNLNIVNLGYVKEYELLAEVYNLSDVFVTTTIQDSGPMMVNQSIACGTPVVCFNIGVARDIVIDEETGYTVDLFDSVGIAESIIKLIDKNTTNIGAIRESCSNLAKKEYSIEVSAKKVNDIINRPFIK